MGNDMTWEQKCRISALRAACASPYDHPTGISDESTDDIVTKHILARAELFRVALLGDNALDDCYHGQEALGPKSTPSSLNEQVYIGTCKHCLTAIQLFNPFNDEAARWVDRHGYSRCENKQMQVHEPELEEQVPIGAEPLGMHCPECGASSREMPLQLEDKSTCHNEWHKYWCNCQAIPGSLNYPGPWHKRAGEPHYPCATSESNVCPSCSSSNQKVQRIAGCNHRWHRE